MNKNFMAYVLIIFGISLIVGGVKMLINQNKETIVVHSFDVSPKTDTVYMQAQPLQKVIEKTIVVEKEIVKKEENQISEKVASQTTEEIVGQTFEDYVVNFLADKRFTLLDRTMDRKTSEA
jgi:hypothetical protein